MSIEFYCDGSPAEVRAYQCGYLAGVREGVQFGRHELAAEQLQQQKELYERLQIRELIEGHLNYVKSVPYERREELAGRRTPQRMAVAA